MATAHSRVTLVHGSRRVDLTVPGTVPVADVLPQLLRYCAPPERPDQPAAWSLGRVGGASFPLTHSLSDEDIVDGEVLELRAPSQTVVRAAHVEDVRDAVEEAVDAAGVEWLPTTTIRFALAIAVAGLLAAVLLPQARLPHDAATLALSTVVTAAALAAARWRDRRGDGPTAAALVLLAVVWGGLAGWLASTYLDGTPELHRALILCGALVTAAVARVFTPVAIAYLAVAAVLTPAALLPAALAGSGVDPWTAVRLDAVLAVLLVGVLPRVSLALGGLAGADYRVRTFGLVTAATLAVRIRQSGALLQGGIVGVAATAATAAVALAYTDSIPDRLLGATVGVALLLRSRVFSRVPHVLPLRVGSAAVLIGHGLRAATEVVPPGAWLAGAVVAAAAAVVAVGATPLSDVARAHLKRLLNAAEAVTVIAMIALAAAAMGCFDWIGRITG